jgi:hypothetical protein
MELSELRALSHGKVIGISPHILKEDTIWLCITTHEKNERTFFL